MLVIGLTGGIGSGKTMATHYFERLGITVVDADKVARLIVEPGQPALHEISQQFGVQIINADGTLNRAALREIVFADPAQRKILEQITHLRIAEEIQRQLSISRSPYTILVSPLLFESGQQRFTQRTLLIDADEALQRTRAAARDNVSEAQITAIITAQMSRQKRQQLADDVVLNDGKIEHLHHTLQQLHQRYLLLAHTPNTKNNDIETSMTGIGQPEFSAVDTKVSAEILCPQCGEKVAWTAASLFRPFCSERCRLIDLGAWASGSHHIPGADLTPGDEDTY